MSLADSLEYPKEHSTNFFSLPQHKTLLAGFTVIMLVDC